MESDGQGILEVGLSARLPQRLLAGGRAPVVDAHRPRPRCGGEHLHRRRRLRQGRALCRARAPSRPAEAAAAEGGREGQGRVPADLVGRRAERSDRSLYACHATARARGGMALSFRRHDGRRAALGPRPAAPRLRLFAPEDDDLRHARRIGLARRRRQALGARSARDGGVRSHRRVGRQSGVHPGQCDDPHRQGAQAARRQARGGRRLSHARPSRPPTSAWCCGPAPTARWRSP